MPERWEHELKKLRNVETPSTLQDHVAEGPHPHHEPGRPTRERLAAAVVAFAVCAAVGVVGYQSISDDDVRGGSKVATGIPSGDRALVLELSSDGAQTHGQPTTTLRYGDEGQDGVIEGWNWCPEGSDNCTSGIADFAFYPPPNEFLVVPPGTPIQVVGDGSVEALTFQDMDGNAVSGPQSRDVPTDDGRYAIQVQATWPPGDATVWFGIQVLSSEAAAPDVLTVDCSLGLVRTDTSVVRTNPDGLHIRFTGSEGSRAFEILSLDGGTYAVGGEATGDVRPTWSVDPGSWAVGCGRDVDIANAASFELVDPDDHHAPEQLGCGEMPQTAFTSSVPSDVPHDEAIGRLMSGLADDDRIRGAGYGADTWHLGFTYVVDRQGEAVARVVLAERDGAWTGTFEQCGDSGITLSDAIVTTGGGATGTTGGGATGPVSTGSGVTGATGAVDTLSETLVVRCEGLGPVTDSPFVQLQPDGLHIEATNVADAALVVFEADDGSSLGEMIVFERPTETAVIQLEPGRYWVGCISGAAGTDVERIPRSESPELYVSFEVYAEE